MALLMNSHCAKGTCMIMCPESEIQMRQREGLVHVLEAQNVRTGRKGSRIIADKKKMVKMFSRSAAGRDMLRPEDLRPPPILRKTVNYLLSIIVCNEQVPWTTVYAFVTDRLRAVRQDMVIQQPAPAISVGILEPIVRFHAYSAYRLCEEPLDTYDPHLNNTHLNECLKQLLVCYDMAEGKRMSGNRDQMEALYGLLHLGNEDAIYRMLSLDASEDNLLSVALRMSLAHFNNNFVAVCHLLRCLPPLHACVAVQHLPRIRRKALLVMNGAYSSKNLRYPLSHIRLLLLYTDDTEAANECRHYGISLDANNVHFLKGSFDLSVKESQPKRVWFVDGVFSNILLPELFLTGAELES